MTTKSPRYPCVAIRARAFVTEADDVNDDKICYFITGKPLSSRSLVRKEINYKSSGESVLELLRICVLVLSRACLWALSCIEINHACYLDIRRKYR